jgi:hypothetical protein
MSWSGSGFRGGRRSLGLARSRDEKLIGYVKQREKGEAERERERERAPSILEVQPTFVSDTLTPVGLSHLC